MAVFLALSGTALALPGKNTVDSGDIINGEVKSGDIRAGAVKTAKVADDNLTGNDIANTDSLGSPEIGGLGGEDITDGSLTGFDLDESTLGQVPSAAIGGIGRWAGGSTCNPETTDFVDCGSVTLNLPAQARVLVNGAGYALGLSGESDGQCRLNTSRGGPASTIDVYVEHRGNFSLVTITGPLTPGNVDFGVECNDDFGNIFYGDIQVSAVAISPN